MRENLVNFVNRCWNKESIFAVLVCGKKKVLHVDENTFKVSHPGRHTLIQGHKRHSVAIYLYKSVLDTKSDLALLEGWAVIKSIRSDYGVSQ